ncbi:MAG: hypothetical protein MJ133_06800 [Lachnospiraceae bacterium]|nr:hypothetical protein [Lachnospiraceae bacterium]
MFYYCEQCASIENIKNANGVQKCKVCEYELKEVPSEYLMSNGSFFKSQDDRKRLLESIISGENYNSELGDNKEAIKSEKDAIEKEAITKRNEELKAEQEAIFSLECPVCHKKSVSKISNVGKIAKVYAFGLYGAGDLGKTYKCNICGCKF